MKRFFLFFFLSLMTITSAIAQDQVMASGTWYKLGIMETGIYKIDAEQFRKMGIDTKSIDPRSIRIYGKAGGMLDQANGPSLRPALNEIYIWVHGEADGSFDGDDMVLFYTESSHAVKYDSMRNELFHQVNYYSDTAFYYLTFGGAAGKRIEKAGLPDKEVAEMVTEFDDYWYHEKNVTNILKSGREWWGEYLSGSTPLAFEIKIPDVVPNSDIKMRTSAIGAAQKPTKFVWHLNGKTVGEGELGTVTGGTYDVKALRKDATYITKALPGDAATLKAGVTYDKAGQSGALGYLNFISIQTRRILQSSGEQQVFYVLPQKTDTVTYHFKNTHPGYHLWNVTDPLAPAVVFQNSSVPETFTANHARAVNKYMGFNVNNALAPVHWRRVPNQHISALTTPDLLIVAPVAWENEARRLAAFREENDQLQVAVVTTAQIYQAYAAGQPDISAIRNFVRDLDRKNPGQLKYLLLFGDATYDYKNILLNQTQTQRNNWVPVYESRESLNPVYTYSSDDYFGFLETTEGNWAENLAGDHSLDIGLGRLPAKTIGEARSIVDKLIRYESSRSKGIWKNSVRFVADDGDGNIHQSHADQLAILTEKKFLSKRMFIDEAEQVDTNIGEKAPTVNSDIRKSIEEGTLILNYTGHGGVSGWAEEQIMTLEDMQLARGIDNLPLLFTATCDFGRYDDPGVVSGAELMVLSPRGAAIGAISTTRPVYSSTNFTLSKAFYESLVAPASERRVGDLFRETKNNALVGSLNRNFALLGDPSMKLLDRHLGIRWVQSPDTLKPLQNVILSGEIFDQVTGKRDDAFNGIVRATIYDRPNSFKTLGKGGAAETYREYRMKMFDGHVSVKNGLFKVQFVVSVDVIEPVATGRANMYAISSDSARQAAAQLDVFTGGRKVTSEDRTPPTVFTYLNAPSFKDGDTVEPSAVFYARLSDDSGIDLSGTGNGAGITLTLNDTLTIVLNNYYISTKDDFRSGLVRYPFENLPAGQYVAVLKVRDTHTNYSEFTFGFLVGSPSGIRFSQFRIYPNPFSDLLSFELTHNRTDEDIELNFNVFLTNGQKLGTLRRQYYNSNESIRETIGAEELGRWIPKNVMLLYQLELRSLKDNTKDRRSGQLIRNP